MSTGVEMSCQMDSVLRCYADLLTVEPSSVQRRSPATRRRRRPLNIGRDIDYSKGKPSAEKTGLFRGPRSSRAGTHCLENVTGKTAVTIGLGRRLDLRHRDFQLLAIGVVGDGPTEWDRQDSAGRGGYA